MNKYDQAAKRVADVWNNKYPDEDVAAFPEWFESFIGSSTLIGFDYRDPTDEEWEAIEQISWRAQVEVERVEANLRWRAI